MTHSTRIQFAWLFFATFLLSACGGGGSDGPSDANVILVNAGPDQSVNEGATVTLSGQASGSDNAFTFAWSGSPAVTVDQSSSDSADATFTAPTVITPTVYTLTLTATDSGGNRGTDSIAITIQPINALPTATASISPTADANGNYAAGVAVTLDASASTDSDPVDPNMPIVAYQWQQTAGADQLSGLDTDVAQITFTTPILMSANTLRFEVTVTDGEGGSATTEVTVPVLAASDTPPTVNAGFDQEVFPGESIILSGQVSSTVPAAAPFSYEWSGDGSLPITVDAPTQQNTFAAAPSVETAQTFNIRLTGIDSFGNRVDDDMTVRVRPFPLPRINDTGMTQQANANSNNAAYQADFPGQDGQRGQDIIATNGQLEKAGSGDAGFDFTRLDALGDEVDGSGQPWSCVRDNATGLVWEVKTDDTSLHGNRHTYTWFLSNNNGGIDGDQLGLAGSCTLANCNTTAFINAVNAEGLCNFFDWRLPTHDELLSLVHFGQSASPYIDANFFSHTATALTPPLWYWSSTPGVDGASATGAETAWAIDYASGNDNFLEKNQAVFLRLVRGGR